MCVYKLAACVRELHKLHKDTPFLRTEHLRYMVNKARKQGNKDKEKTLLTMLRKEYNSRQDGCIRAGFGKPASNPVSCVSTTSPESETQILYKGEEDTVRV